MIVIDANAIVKLALEEEHSQEVRKFIYDSLSSDQEEIITVDIALAESLNAVWKHNVVIKDLADSKFELASSEILEFWNNLDKIPSYLIANEARQIAKKHKLAVYDSFYVAGAIKNDALLLTFDGGIIKNEERLGVKILKL